MKLSNAILKGCKIHKHQCFDTFFTDINGNFVTHMDSEKIHSSCAMAAAFVGGYKYTYYDDLDKPLCCPYCDLDYYQSASLVNHLNDIHKISREEIAAYLQTIDL